MKKEFKKIKIFIWFLVAIIIIGFIIFSSKKTDKIGESKVYQSQDKNFSFEYPKNFVASSGDLDSGGKKIVVESTEPKKGFQITILPFDEAGPLTVARIKQDLPDMIINDASQLLLNLRGGEGGVISAVAFNSTDENIGNTYEVWFVSGGNLYQIQTYEEFALSLQNILKSWKFK